MWMPLAIRPAEQCVLRLFLADMERLGIEFAAEADNLLRRHNSPPVGHFLPDLEILEMGVRHHDGGFDGHGIARGAVTETGRSMAGADPLGKGKTDGE